MLRSLRHLVFNPSTIALAVALAAPMTIRGFAQQSPPPAPQTTQPTLRLVPDDLRDTSWLDRLRDAQIKSAAGLASFHDFTFTDRFSTSGITFRNRIVDDSGKAYKAAHYDHGTGVAIADVDGDGRLDVYFVNQVGGNQLARNLGGGRFEDITAAAGVGVPGKVSVAASFADIDNDGDADLYVTTVRAGNMLFENDGHGRFRDVSASSGLNHTGHSSGAVFFDYDRDGRLDLFLLNVGRYTTDTIGGAGYKYYVAFEDAFSGHLKPEREEPNILYRNVADKEGRTRFVDVSKAMGIQDRTWAGDASILDANDDGWPDLYVLNMQGDNEYYENDHGKRFVRKSRVLFPKTSWGAMGIKVFDFNNDGRLDIFVTDMHSDMSDMTGPELDKVKSTMKWPESFRGIGKTSIWGNTFFLKEGPNKYREVSDEINVENYCPWGPSVGDLNADGFDDIFIASGMNYPYRYMVNATRLNDRGQRFVDAEFVLGIEPRQGPHQDLPENIRGLVTPWFLLDASGRDKGHRDAEGLTGPVGIWGARGTRAAAIFDLDGDGDLDIVTNEFGTVPMVLVSDLADKTKVHYLEVALTGTTSNRNGLGAVVKVTAGTSTYTKVMDGSSGYLSHSIAPLYFGLGAADTVDRVEVAWPSGTKQVVTGGITLNSRLTIKEQ